MLGNPPTRDYYKGSHKTVFILPADAERGPRHNEAEGQCVMSSNEVESRSKKERTSDGNVGNDYVCARTVR